VATLSRMPFFNLFVVIIVFLHHSDEDSGVLPVRVVCVFLAHSSITWYIVY
jgi:hypothetical protein